MLEVIFEVSLNVSTSELPYISSLWVQFVLAFLGASSVYLQSIYSVVLNCILAIP